MTRFTRDLSRRVERDLTQISDHASPSSTAWEAIQHRIDEQDTTEPTMEVIMLDPDTNRLQKRPRTGMLVAASIAAIALVGGLVVLANRDDGAPPADRPDLVPTVVVTDPAIAGDPEPAPVVVDPELSPSTDAAAVPAADGEVLPPAEPATEGVLLSRCTFDNASPDPVNDRTVVDQRCENIGEDDPPFPGEQSYELTLFEAGVGEPAAVFLSVNDEVMTAGYTYGDPTQQRWVGIAEGGAPNYEGEPIHFAGRGSDGESNSPDDDTNEADWWLADGPRPSNTEDAELTAEVTVVCEQVAVDGPTPTFDQTCTYDGDDPRFVPQPESGRLVVLPADFATTVNGSGAVMGTDFFTSTSDSNSTRAGLRTGGTVVRWVGVRPGTGEFEGMLIHEVGWGEIVDQPISTVTGVIQITVLPIDG